MSAEKVVTDTPRKLVLEVNHLGKQWFMQSFEDKMIDLILKKIYKLIKPLNLDILQNFTAKPNIYGSIAGHLAKIPHFIFHLLFGSYELTQFTHYIFLVTGIRILGASYPQNGESFRQPPATI
jgi:hypothetical protein